jgi:outer membrane protein assembly factor BamB
MSRRNGEKQELICVSSKATCAVDAGSGGVLWQLNAGALYSSPAVLGDWLLILNQKTGLAAFNLSSGKPEPQWTYALKDPATMPLLRDGHAYVVAGGKGVCLELTTGTATWEQNVPSGECVSPVLADGKLYTMDGRSSRLVMLRVTPEKCAVLATAKLPDISKFVSPVIADGRLFVRGNKAVYCLDLRADACP